MFKAFFFPFLFILFLNCYKSLLTFYFRSWLSLLLISCQPHSLQDSDLFFGLGRKTSRISGLKLLNTYWHTCPFPLLSYSILNEQNSVDLTCYGFGPDVDSIFAYHLLNTMLWEIILSGNQEMREIREKDLNV